MRHRIRVLLVGEGPRILALANAIVNGPLGKHFVIVGWLLDSRRKAANRFQQFGQFHGDREECLKLAAARSVSTFDGSIHIDAFRPWLFSLGEIDLTLMAGFGWRVIRPLIDHVNGWWLNSHPSPKYQTLDEFEWPNEFAGPQPYQLMLLKDVLEVGIVLHSIDEEFDRGVALAQSEGRPMWNITKSLETKAEAALFLKHMHERMADPYVSMISRLALPICEAIQRGWSPEQLARSLPISEIIQEPASC